MTTVSPDKDEVERAAIKLMVDRFLAWKLPADFNPDGGISFRQVFGRTWPIGTNLFTATQAKEMVRHMLAAMSPVDNQWDAGHACGFREGVKHALAASPVDRLREALEKRPALPLVYDLPQLRAFHRRYSEWELLVQAALSSPEPVGEVANE